jgi:hypothetical protein
MDIIIDGTDVTIKVYPKEVTFKCKSEEEAQRLAFDWSARFLSLQG